MSLLYVGKPDHDLPVVLSDECGNGNGNEKKKRERKYFYLQQKQNKNG